MQLEEAYRLLHITTEDSEREIRTKYHKAIRQYHPDAANINPEQALDITKQLNLAFRMVIQHVRAEADFRRAGFAGNHSDDHFDTGKNTGAQGSSRFSRGGTAGQSAGHSSSNGSADRYAGYSSRNDSADRHTGYSSWASYAEGDAYYARSDSWSAQEPEEEDASASKWPAAENPAAFCERTIYAVGDFYSSMGWIYEESPDDPVNDPDEYYERDYLRSPRPVASGKYYWDPDYESFPMFLFSIHQKCKSLLHSEVIDPMLLHYLALEFIRPWDCLSKIADDYPDIHVESAHSESGYTESAHSEIGRRFIYRVRGRVRLDSSDGFARNTRLHSTGEHSGNSKPDSSADPAGIEAFFTPVIVGEQIHLFLPDGRDIGHLSFEEDPLYYISLMILRAKTGTIRIEDSERRPDHDHPGSSESAPGKRFGGKNTGNQHTVRLSITLTPSSDHYSDLPERRNLDIARLMQDYG